MKTIKNMLYVFYPLIIFLMVKSLVSVLLYMLLYPLWFQHTTLIASVTSVASGVVATLPVLPSFLKFNDVKKLDMECILSTCNSAILSALAFTMSLSVIFSHVDTSAWGASVISAVMPMSVEIILYVIISPVFEEIVFRGLLYKRLKIILPVSHSVILSGVIFGIYHGNVVQGVYAAGMGMVMAYLYEQEDNILVPVLFHAVANLTVMIFSLIL